MYTGKSGNSQDLLHFAQWPLCPSIHALRCVADSDFDQRSMQGEDGRGTNTEHCTHDMALSVFTAQSWFHISQLIGYTFSCKYEHDIFLLVAFFIITINVTRLVNAGRRLTYQTHVTAFNLWTETLIDNQLSSELCPSSGWNIKIYKITTFRKLVLLPSSGEGGETPTQMGQSPEDNRFSINGDV